MGKSEGKHQVFLQNQFGFQELWLLFSGFCERASVYKNYWVVLAVRKHKQAIRAVSRMMEWTPLAASNLEPSKAPIPWKTRHVFNSTRSSKEPTGTTQALKHAWGACKGSEIPWGNWIAGTVSDSAGIWYHLKLISKSLLEVLNILHTVWITFNGYKPVWWPRKQCLILSLYSTTRFYTVFSCWTSVVERAGSAMK